MPLVRSSVTMRSSCGVFHKTTALDSRLGLVHDHLEVGRPELALVGEEQPSSQAVAGLAAVELGLDAQAERLVVQVAQDVAGFHQPAKGGERLGDAVGRAA